MSVDDPAGVRLYENGDIDTSAADQRPQEIARLLSALLPDLWSINESEPNEQADLTLAFPTPQARLEAITVGNTDDRH
jgi:hypothetical protein